MPIEDQRGLEPLKRFNAALSRNLKEIRVGQGLSIDRLAIKANMSPTTVFRAENPDVISRNDTIFLLCAALEFDPRTLITWSLELAFEGTDADAEA
jgi:transcriptional regulator with XRE-family HTH domain